ncbi:MAG: pyruvate dehydrogenase (acetyl-transferring) E1 component subunit alpha [Planctomycetota bacterium]|jgi:2-oxoisovalerate dehydrogenase E1 component alpha subunit|nr:pyruvate dehydrogenase (acetyl-transferring) E1 component subunit alpha [Planctomycetota bacterium]
MTENVLQVIAEDGTAVEAKPDLSREDLLRMYEAMVKARAVDERGMNLQRQGRISFYVPATGQEASHVGAAFALRDSDWVVPSYRNPGISLLRGISIQMFIDQLFGNERDVVKGRQMPNHFAFSSINFLSISSPISTQIPQAAGLAMAMQYRDTDQVCMTFCGDGGTSEGDFHCGLNFAGVYQSPIVFVVENNGWAITCPVERQTASESMAIKAKAYGFEGIRVDGNDCLAVYAAAKEAVEKARSGGGPTLIETMTYRMGPHSSSDDPRRYRSDEEVASWAEQDPIQRFNRYLLANIDWTEEEDEALHARCHEEAADAARSADAAPLPPDASMFEDVFAEMPPHLQEQLDELRDHLGRQGQ